MSEAQVGENNPMFGITGEKHHMFGKPRPEGAGNGLPPQRVEVFYKDTNTTTTYDSLREAGRALNIKHHIISKYFSRNQQKPYKNRYIFKLLA
jgi:hypothetical protein